MNNNTGDSFIKIWGFHFLASIMLTGMVFFLFTGSLCVGFIGDDYYFLDASDTFSKVTESFTSDWFWRDPAFIGARFYRPMQILMTYIEQYVLWGDNAWGYHLDLLIIHIVNSLLIVVLTGLLLSESGIKKSFCLIWAAGFIFAMHPRHTESVCMINGRTDSLCALFYLGSLATYVAWRRNGNRLALIGSLVSFALALLSKEMAISLPVILIIYEITRYRRERLTSSKRPRIYSYLKAAGFHWALFIIIFGILRTWALSGYIFGKSSYITPFTTTKIYLLSICKLSTVLVLPFESIFHRLAERFILSPGMYGWSFIALASVGLLFSIYKGRLLWSLGLSIWFISAVPVLTQLTEMYTTLSERYIYIPSIGVALIMADVLYRAARIHKFISYAIWGILAVWLAAAIPLNWKYVSQWRIAGAESRSIIEQIEKLDQERPLDESFCIISIPNLYEGKYIINTGFERYFNNKKIAQGKRFRLMTPILHLDVNPPLEYSRTKTIWDGNIIEHSVEGGLFRFPFPTAHPGIQLLNDPTDFPLRKARIEISPIPWPVLLLSYDQGKLIPASKPIEDIVIAQGSGGDGFIERIQLKKALDYPGDIHIAVPEGLQKDGSIDPRRGLHLSKGDVDGDDQDDLVFTLGPTDSLKPSHPGLVIAWNNSMKSMVGHPFSPFPRYDKRPIRNTSGEVFTAVGRFIPGRDSSQIACAQGRGGNQIIRLFEYTGKEPPHGFRVVSQFIAFDEAKRKDNKGGGVTLSSGDFNGDGIDELVLGPTNSANNITMQIVAFNEIAENGLHDIQNSPLMFPAFSKSEINHVSGVIQTTGDIDGDGIPELLTAAMNPADNTDAIPDIIYIWKFNNDSPVMTEPSLLCSISLSEHNPQKPPLHSIRLFCGNFDLDPAQEVCVGIVENTKNPLAYVKVFDLHFDNNKSLTKTTSIIQTDAGYKIPGWESRKLEWLDVISLYE